MTYLFLLPTYLLFYLYPIIALIVCYVLWVFHYFLFNFCIHTNFLSEIIIMY